MVRLRRKIAYDGVYKEYPLVRRSAIWYRGRFALMTLDPLSKRILADFSRRCLSCRPGPSSSLLVRSFRQNIAGIIAGEPKYNKMSPGLAAITRQQLPQLKTMFTNFGAIESIAFKRVEEDGTDVYDIEFEHGSTEWRIFLLADGTVDRLGFRPL